MIKSNAILSGVVLVVLSGCMAVKDEESAGISAEHKNLAASGSVKIPAESSEKDLLTDPDGELALQQALALTLMKNPSLEAYSHGWRAAEAEMLQARVLPNPSLEFEVENLDRDGAGYDSAEPSVKLSQLIELGGKRRSRIEKARADSELSFLEYECRRLDVLAETARRFVAVICAQERRELAEALLKTAERTAATVAERVKAGKESPVQRAKATAELELTRIEFVEAQNALSAERQRLSVMWGGDVPRFARAVGNIGEIGDKVPSLDRLRVQLETNPVIAAADANVRVHEAELSSLKAERIPDVEVGAGVQHFEEDGTDAVILSAAFPLPLFDLKKGAISSAGHKLERARAERRGVVAELSADLAEAYSALVSSHRKVLVLRNDVVPAMEGAHEAAYRGYTEGKFALLDVLDTQRSLFMTRGRLIDATQEYHAALSRIEKLAGKSINEFIEEGN